ncbi:MAG: prepilin-type N-terminal cleavage/methylation domain-containing protein [Porticoccaceae bacterium]|nr:prepilin-type N-terminal cleavage/methylation domain-containing protein [Porticoccaceae bacterium]
MGRCILRISEKGFSLVELMIVIAIIGVLALVALPSYRNFILKAEFIETKMALGAVKVSLEVCVRTMGLVSAGRCVNNSHGIPANNDPAEGIVGVKLAGTAFGKDSAVTENDTLTITATAATDSRNVGATFKLTGKLKSGGGIVWDDGVYSKPELC